MNEPRNGKGKWKSQEPMIPANVLAPIAKAYRKRMLVLVAVGGEPPESNFVSYGVEPREKVAAASLSESIAAHLLGPTAALSDYLEDFRHVPAAERAQKIEQCSDAARAAMHLCSALLACREGVTDVLIEEVRVACADAVAAAAGGRKGP